MKSIFSFFRRKKAAVVKEVTAPEVKVITTVNPANKSLLTNFLKLNKKAREKKAVRLGFSNASVYIASLKKLN